MVNLVKEFPGKVKKYIDHICTVSFGELLVYLLEVLILLAIPLLLVSFSVSLVKDLLYYILLVFIKGSSFFFRIYDAIFGLINAVLLFFGFIYMFSRRYNSFEKEIKDDKKVKSSKNKSVEVEEIELPKVK